MTVVFGEGPFSVLSILSFLHPSLCPWKQDHGCAQWYLWIPAWIPPSWIPLVVALAILTPGGSHTATKFPVPFQGLWSQRWRNNQWGHDPGIPQQSVTKMADGENGSQLVKLEGMVSFRSRSSWRKNRTCEERQRTSKFLPWRRWKVDLRMMRKLFLTSCYEDTFTWPSQGEWQTWTSSWLVSVSCPVGSSSWGS